MRMHFKISEHFRNLFVCNNERKTKIIFIAEEEYIL